MASNKPVPSKAAINALRGLAFTTSCTVILLAEERRRRLKIAQAAVDNARKLHTARDRGRAIALVGQYAWDDRYAELDDDVRATLPLSMGHRKRQITKPSEDCQVSPRLNKQRETELREKHPSRVTNRHLVDSEQDLIREALALLSSTIAKQSHAASHIEHTTSKGNHSSVVSQSPRRAIVLEERATTLAPDHTEKSRSGLRSLKTGSANTEIHFQKAFDFAEDLLIKFKTQDLPPTDAAHAIRLLLDALDHSSFNAKVTQEASRLLSEIFQTKMFDSLQLRGTLTDKDCLRALQSAVRYAPENLGIMCSPTFKCCQDVTLLNVAFFEWIQSDEVNSQKITKALASLDEASSMKPHPNRYSTRLMVARLAIAAGDWNLASENIRGMVKLDAESMSQDIEDIMQEILRTRAKPILSSDAQDAMALVCDLYIHNRPAMEYERYLRQLNEKHGMKICQRWVNPIIDWHWSNNDDDSAFSWLRFALSNHIRLNTYVLLQTFAHCEKYWGTSASQKGMAWLYRRLRATGVSLPKYGGMKSSEQSKGLVVHSHRARAKDGSSTARFIAGGSTLELSTFLTLKKLVKLKDWIGILRSYGEYHSRGGNFSARCLKMAVTAHLNSSRHGFERATELVEDAIKNGQNVDDALTPLLVCELRKTSDPSQPILNALDRGLTVSGKVFNVAFKTLGKRGELKEGIHICHMAAKYQGRGNLLFADWNFSNLLYAYVALGPAYYNDLRQILTKFMEQKMFWNGNKICKEAVKHAIKIFAARSIKDPELKQLHEEMVYLADEVLYYIGQCRVKHTTQQTAKLPFQPGNTKTVEVLPHGCETGNLIGIDQSCSPQVKQGVARKSEPLIRFAISV